MNKIKLFVENFLVYGIGGIISKIIPLIMLPIITIIMPNTEYYGISDMFNTVVSFGGAFALMGMYDAMYRMFFENNDVNYKKAVCSVTFGFTMITSIIVSALMVIFARPMAKFFFSSEKYFYVVLLSAMATLVSGTNTIISAPTRMQNKRKVFVVANTIGPLIAYIIAIPMLLRGYYIIALPVATFISGLTMEVAFFVINHKWFSTKKYDKKLLKQLLIIAIPLLPNYLIYWVFNSCDKFMITNIIGLGDLGVYSVASKFGQCSQLIYIAFAGGWQFFAFSTMKESNQVKSNSKIFEYLGIISFIITGFVCAWSYGLFKVLFKAEYLSGYIVAPYLFLAPLIQMLFQVASNQFLVVKKTWPNLFILIIGALINVLLNYLLIPLFGIEGASLATLMGYVISDVVCLIVLCHMKLMIVSKRFVIATFATITFMIIWRLLFSNQIIIGTFMAVTLLCLLVVFYKNDLRRIICMIKGKQ